MPIAFLLFTGPLHAEEKPRIEVWLINTRCAPVCGDWDQGKERIRYWRLDDSRQWEASTVASFSESSTKNSPTIFLLHGNRTSDDEAIEFAWPVYNWLSQNTCRQDGREPYRVVIWSWPSSRTSKRTRPDVQTKAYYCDSQSYYLADCLRGMKSDTPVSLIGYSFGARIITGGLHLLGGGTLAGHSLPMLTSVKESNTHGRPIRAVLVAAATDCFALAPGQVHGEATAQVEEMLVTRNGCDDALRFYPRLYGRGGPEAMGYVGPCCENRENILLYDVTCTVGKSHDWEGYIECSGLLGVLPHYVFVEAKDSK